MTSLTSLPSWKRLIPLTVVVVILSAGGCGFAFREEAVPLTTTTAVGAPPVAGAPPASAPTVSSPLITNPTGAQSTAPSTIPIPIPTQTTTEVTMPLPPPGDPGACQVMDEVDRLITVLNQQFNVLDNNTDIGYVRDTSAALKAKVRGLYSVAPDEIRGDLEELGRALNLLVGAGDSARSVEDYQSLLAENQPALRVFDASLVKINRWYKPRCLRTN